MLALSAALSFWRASRAAWAARLSAATQAGLEIRRDVSLIIRFKGRVLGMKGRAKSSVDAVWHESKNPLAEVFDE